MAQLGTSLASVFEPKSSDNVRLTSTTTAESIEMFYKNKFIGAIQDALDRLLLNHVLARHIPSRFTQQSTTNVLT